MITINCNFFQVRHTSLSSLYIYGICTTVYICVFIKEACWCREFFCVEPPPDIAPTVNVSVLPGDSAVLTCIVYSTVPYNVTWYGPGGVIGQNQQFTNFNNGSLFIRWALFSSNILCILFPDFWLVWDQSLVVLYKIHRDINATEFYKSSVKCQSLYFLT